MRRVVFIAVLSVLVVAWLLGGRWRGDVGPPAVAGSEMESLEVLVVGARTGEAIPRARVVARDMGRTRAVTAGDDGRCALRLRRCLAAVARLHVSASGRVPVEVLVRSRRLAHPPLVVAMERGRRLVTGRLDGGPGRVSLEIARPRPRVVSGQRVRWDVAVGADGAFRTEVPWGAAAVLIARRRIATGCVGARIPIPPGTAPLDLGVVTPAGRPVGVVVTDGRGAPLAGIPAVFRAGADPGRAVRSRSDGCGRLTLTVPPDELAGTVDLHVANRILGGFPVFAGRGDRLSVRR